MARQRVRFPSERVQICINLKAVAHQPPSDSRRLDPFVATPRSSGNSIRGFDPYRVWLAIPKGIKHPNYYHILGIAQGESNVHVIRSAIEQRRSYVLSKRGEGHDASVQQILALIEEATATLLVAEYKHGYDRHLGLHLRGRPGRFGKALLLPPWMESRVVRVYGEGSGLLVEVFGLVAILFGPRSGCTS